MTKPAPVYILGGAQTDFARNWTKEGKHFVGPDARGRARRARSDRKSNRAKSRPRTSATSPPSCTRKQGHIGAFFLEIDPAFSGLPTSRHEAACASGSIALLAASAEIEAAATTWRACVGVEQMKTVDSTTGGDYLGTAAWYEREAKGIEFPFPKLFGRLGDEYDKRYGLKDEHLAHISAVNYSNAKRNPQRADPQLVHEREPRAARKQVQHGHRRTHQGERLLAGDRRLGRDFPRVGKIRDRMGQAQRQASSPTSRASSDGAIIRRRSNSTPRSPRAATTLTCCRIRARRSSTRSSARASPASSELSRHRDARLLHHLGVHGDRSFRHHQAGRIVEGGRGRRHRARRQAADQSERRTDRRGPSGRRDRRAPDARLPSAGNRHARATTRSRARRNSRC